jgi:hypothetical protein
MFVLRLMGKDSIFLVYVTTGKNAKKHKIILNKTRLQYDKSSVLIKKLGVHSKYGGLNFVIRSGNYIFGMYFTKEKLVNTMNV